MSDPLSACHQAPVKLVGGRGDFSDHEEGMTMHYECSVCLQPANLAAPQQQSAGELRELYQRADVSNNRTDNPIGEDEFVTAIEQLIASRLTAQLDELEDEGPKDDIDEQLSAQHDLAIPQGVHGYRVANSQWRALLAKAKEGL